MFKKRNLILLTLLLATWSVAAAATGVPAPQPHPEILVVREPVEGPVCIGTNLLVNPSFEGNYSTYVPPNGHPDCPAGICQTAQMAAGWTPYWKSHNDADPGHIIRMPEYKPAELIFTDPYRVRSGSRAQQYFTFYSTHRAGLLQQVPVQNGALYCLSVYGHAWSAQSDEDAYSDPYPNHGFLNQKIGIDPTGGVDWESGAIVWGGERVQYDYYGAFMALATAQGSQVTAYMRSEPLYAMKHNDVYWDDAALVRVTFDVVGTASFVQQYGQAGPENRSLAVPITGPEDMTWSAVVQAGATAPVTVTPGGGVGNELTITVNGSGLAPGYYTASVVVTPSVALPAVTVPVDLLVVDFAESLLFPIVASD